MKSKQIKLKVDGIEKDYVLKPLKWDDFPKLYGLVSKFNGTKEEDIISKLGENEIKVLMELELKMFIESYPHLKEDDLKPIIQENLFDLLGILVELNFPVK